MQNAAAQAIRINQIAHEAYLVDTGFKEEARKFGKGFFTQMTTPVQIIAARQVTSGKVPFIRALIARQPTCHGPNASCIKGIKQHSVRHEPSDATVTVKERVNPC